MKIDLSPKAAPLSINLSKRRLLQGAGAALVLGVLSLKPLIADTKKNRDTDFGAFLKMTPDGRITVLICQAEIGQGSTTGLSMIVAEELGASWSDIEFEFASGRPEYFHPIIYQNEQITGGSVSIVGFMEPMRLVAAAAREMLTAAAAKQLSVDMSLLKAEASHIVDTQSTRRIPFRALLSDAAAMPAPTKPTLRNFQDTVLIGTPTRRLDAPPKINGSAVFGIDVDVPNMAYAAVRQAPVFGKRVQKIDDSLAKKMTGVIGVYAIPDGYAVVATQYWQAAMALENVRVEYAGDAKGLATSQEVEEHLVHSLNRPDTLLAHQRGDATKEMSTTQGAYLESVYEVPFLAHATMEPMNATASVTAKGAELWVPTQAVTLDEIAVSKALGIPREQVKIHMTYVGGAFGRRGFSEYAVQAALLSRATKRPVKVVWSRAEDIKQDYLRPAFAAKLRGAITADGKIKALSTTVAGPGIWAFNRPPVVEHFNGIDHLAIEGLNDLRYEIPNIRVDHAMTEPDRKIGYWRSIGYSHNVYFIESFVDELAHSVEQDPYTLRMEMLAEDSRSQHVLKTAAEKAGWFAPRQKNRHLGIAFFATERWQTRVAQVADISLVDNKIKINKMVCVADIGLAINPLSVEAQLQGAIVFGLSAALYGQIDLAAGEVQQSNFSDYRMLTLRDAPPVDVTIIEGAEKPGSVGEIATPCAAPALTNAVYAATTKRIRSLPLQKHGLV